MHGERNHQDVRQREPHRADLLGSGSARIEDAARDVEMRLGVAVIQRVTAIEAPARHRKADGGEHPEDADELNRVKKT